MDVLEIDSVYLKFDYQEVLNSIYLKCETGKITGILGSNGSGKSSLLKIIFGSLLPQTKSLRVNSKTILKPYLSTGEINYLPQFHFVPDNLRVKTAFQLFGNDFHEFTNYFPSFEVIESTKFKNLSGGEKRIIETFLILKSPGKFALLDEPFSHIAPVHINTIIDLIQDQKPKKGIIITDHMYKYVTELSDDLYLLKDGWNRKVKNLSELEFYKYARL